jgi:UDP-glucose 4-epimerase
MPEMEQANIQLTQRLTEALKSHPSIHLIYFSSGGTVYGNPSTLPVPEDACLKPLSHYGAAKVSQEAMCNSLRASGHAVTILRPSNAYGPSQAIKGGFGLVPTLLEHALRGTTLQIWGDGENVRDYVYIDDLLEATALTIFQPGAAGTYNVGSGCGYSVNQVKLLVEQITDRPVATSYYPARGTDVRSVVLDTRQLMARLDWCAEVSLSKGIELVFSQANQQ